MRRTAAGIFPLLFALVAASARATQPDIENAPTRADDDIARLVGYSFTRGGALRFLEALTDTIGGRITGSLQSRAAAELILKTLKDAGFENAHFEEYQLSSTGSAVWRSPR